MRLRVVIISLLVDDRRITAIFRVWRVRPSNRDNDIFILTYQLFCAQKSRLEDLIVVFAISVDVAHLRIERILHGLCMLQKRCELDILRHFFGSFLPVFRFLFIILFISFFCFLHRLRLLLQANFAYVVWLIHVKLLSD